MVFPRVVSMNAPALRGVSRRSFITVGGATYPSHVKVVEVGPRDGLQVGTACSKHQSIFANLTGLV
jgi:hypothetical protein